MLTAIQQGYSLKALEMGLVSKCIDLFLKSYPCLRTVLAPEEMESAAMFACASAARTYDPEKAGISAYFSKAILHELLKSCRREIKSGSQSAYRISLPAIEQRAPAKAEPLADPILAALQSLTDTDRAWIESHVFDGTSIRLFARTEGISARQAAKLLRCRLDRLKRATADQPHWHSGVE